MNIITKYLIKKGVINMDDRLLFGWAKRRKVSSLIYALEHAHYTSRAYAATLLGQFNYPEAVTALNNALDDSMSYVSQSAIKALEQMPISPEVRLNVQSKKLYWERTQPQITKMKKKVTGNLAGFHNSSSIPDPGGFINNDNSGCFG